MLLELGVLERDKQVFPFKRNNERRHILSTFIFVS